MATGAAESGFEVKKDFRRWCRELRKCAPSTIPVSFRRVKLKKWAGRISIDEHANGRPKKINIYIDDSLDREATRDALQHEWAHALAYDRHRSDPELHDGVFGLINAEVYRAWNETK